MSPKRLPPFVKVAAATVFTLAVVNVAACKARRSHQNEAGSAVMADESNGTPLPQAFRQLVWESLGGTSPVFANWTAVSTAKGAVYRLEGFYAGGHEYDWRGAHFSGIDVAGDTEQKLTSTNTQPIILDPATGVITIGNVPVGHWRRAKTVNEPARTVSIRWLRINFSTMTVHVPQSLRENEVELASSSELHDKLRAENAYWPQTVPNVMSRQSFVRFGSEPRQKLLLTWERLDSSAYFELRRIEREDGQELQLEDAGAISWFSHSGKVMRKGTCIGGLGVVSLSGDANIEFDFPGIVVDGTTVSFGPFVGPMNPC